MACSYGQLLHMFCCYSRVGLDIPEGFESPTCRGSTSGMAEPDVVGVECGVNGGMTVFGVVDIAVFTVGDTSG